MRNDTGPACDGLSVVRLKHLRIRQHLQPSELSRLAGLERHTVRYLESGRKNPRTVQLWQIVRLASVLQIPVDELLERAEHRRDIHWVGGDWRDSFVKSLITELQAEMNEGREYFSHSRIPSCWLFPDAMNEWLLTRYFSSRGHFLLDVSAYYQSLIPSLTAIRKHFMSGKQSHTFALSEDNMRVAAEENPAWILEVAARLKECQGSVRVGLASATCIREIDYLVSRAVGGSSWERVGVGGDVSSINPQPRMVLLATHQELRASIGQAFTIAQSMLPFNTAHVANRLKVIAARRS